MKESKEMITENYCDDCDDVLHAVFNAEDFYDFKVGRIRCKCGCVVLPCNECRDENGEHYDCGKCPWAKAKIVNAMTDVEYVRWEKENEPESYEEMKKGEFGDHYKNFIETIEREDNDMSIRILKSFGYELNDVLDDAIVFRDEDFVEDGIKDEKLLKFKSWSDVKKYAKAINK